ncbi:MAG: putative bifunctional diguanylate cyclase/phosphodiesterase, partial [Hyphomicrobiales bacterium]
MIKSLFIKQVAKCTGTDGAVDMDALSRLVIATYEDAERDRRRTDRSISLMVEELDQLNSSLEEKIRRRTAQLHESQREAEKQNSLFDAALKNMAQGLAMYDADGTLVISNQRYAEMYRFPADYVKPGRRLQELFHYRHAHGQLMGDPDKVLETILSSIRQGLKHSRIQQLPDGRHILVNCQPMSDGGWVSTHEDITERREAEQRIAHMARHDSLTDLPNRHTLMDDLSMAVRKAAPGREVAVHFLDLDRFKTINDTLGHHVGDILLKAVAKRLGNCVKCGDMIARIGGDEFAIVQKDIRDREGAVALANRICATVNAPYDLDGHVLVADVSVGIAITPDDGREPGELLKHADLAMHRAKAENKGSYRFFDPEMSARIGRRRELELDLRTAYESGQFEVHYQPIVRLAASKVSSCEALLRWRYPQRGQVSPSEFIPVAEEIGLIVKLGEWVLRTACTDAMSWSGGVGVSVNISPTQV